MRPSLLIINTDQFGYHTDSYKYCEYLRTEFDITYLCFDAKKDKHDLVSVNVIYVDWAGNYIKKGYDFIDLTVRHIRQNNFDSIFMVYFPFCFLIRLLTKKHIILDIRTGSVEKSIFVRKASNFLKTFEALFFKNITIISKSLGRMLRINTRKIKVIPIGADIISEADKVFDYPRLFYVGTLFNRKMHETVIGFKKFIAARDFNKVSYDIFGFGLESEENLLKETIEENNLKGTVTFHGRMSHDEIANYFDNCNIGISYVPMTRYFECQPPTKTYEYVNSGMVCIATNTYENRLLIDERNGVLCDDNPISFSSALSKVMQNKDTYDSNEIRKTLKENNWETIALRLGRYLNSLIIKK